MTSYHIALACAPKADVLCSADVSGEAAFVVRLLEDGGARATFHLKRYSDLSALDAELRRAAAERRAGEGEDKEEEEEEVGTIAHIPSFPTNGTFGIRRTLSKRMGVGGFAQGQVEALQMYLGALLDQIPALAAARELQEFFRERTPEEVAGLPEAQQQRYQKEQQVLKEMLFELRRGVTMQTIKGYWRLGGSENIWLIERSGRAASGNFLGTDYDLTESGAGLERVIARSDGWQIDIEKSSEHRLLWVNPSEPHRPRFIWMREDPVVAKAQISLTAQRLVLQEGC